MFVRASLRVRPWETQPGKFGHSATKTPSSSGSIRTRYFIAAPFYAGGRVGGGRRSHSVRQPESLLHPAVEEAVGKKAPQEDQNARHPRDAVSGRRAVRLDR